MKHLAIVVALACALSPELAGLIQRLETATSSGMVMAAASIDTNKALLTLAREVAKAQCPKEDK